MPMGERCKLSVILPYLSGSLCVGRCIELLKANTRSPFEVCSVVDVPGAYEAYNRSRELAKGHVLVFLNDDMFVPPGWDVPFLPAIQEKTIVTGYLVEPGRLPVNYRNIHRDFGRDAALFEADRFNAFAEAYSKRLPESEPGVGWYMPFAVRREDALPFPTRPDFPNDFTLFGMYAARGYKFRRVRSFAYHLQRMSDWSI
ncbi:MAG TPA: hypothetical protein DCQ94_07435 [Nitrospira sp.]|nr:hypothetical protein [Nitrospira sp.]